MGQIGFDECFAEREWYAAEMDVLKAAASTLGAALRRRRIEEELRGSEERYRAVIEQATDGIYLLDAGTKRIVESNPSFQKMLGYSANEMQGMEVYDFVAHPRDNVDATIRRTLEVKRRVVGGRKYRRKDGSLVDVEVGVSVIFHGGKEVICTIVRDITERARAQELLEERVVTLSCIATNLTLDLPMEDTLDVLAKSLVNASTAVASWVVLMDEKADTLHLVGSRGSPEGYAASLQAVYRAGDQSPTMEALRAQQPLLAHDVRRFVLNSPLYAPIHDFIREAPWDTLYIVPLVSRGQALGVINLCYLPGQKPSVDEKVFFKAVADQTAVSVENARLFSEARGKAALEERQRLARELHDSVSQALYGIALGAKTARDDLLGGDPKQAIEPLNYVLSLAEAGLAEMRALIFELRPESLKKEGLVVALEKQATALRARHDIDVETFLCDEPEASLEMKEDVYHIVQEDLHNTVKHARATSVTIILECDAGWITLEVSDDGIGFDMRGEFPGHLGLRSMHERAARLGGTFRVESAPGRGTRICAQIPV